MLWVTLLGMTLFIRRDVNETKHEPAQHTCCESNTLLSLKAPDVQILMASEDILPASSPIPIPSYILSGDSTDSSCAWLLVFVMLCVFITVQRSSVQTARLHTPQTLSNTPTKTTHDAHTQTDTKFDTQTVTKSDTQTVTKSDAQTDTKSEEVNDMVKLFATCPSTVISTPGRYLIQR